MMESTTLGTVFGSVVALIFLLKKYFERNKNFWRKRGVSELKRESFLKTWIPILKGEKSIFDFDTDMYHGLGEETCGGTVTMGTPELLLKDPELIKQVLVKDFDYFIDRRKMQLHSEPILNSMLTFLEGQEWKNARSVLSPTFTTGKMRRMFEHFNKCGASLVRFIKSRPTGIPNSYEVIVKEAISRYLVDVIGATAFGMETNSLKDDNSIFYKMASRQSEFSMWRMFKGFLIMFLPFLTRFGLRTTDTISLKFFEEICKTAIVNRAASKEKRNDFLQLMIEAGQGQLETDESDLDSFEKDAQFGNVSKGKIVLTDDIITAQSILFFLAGLDTTGSVLAMATYILALNPDIQEKLHEEVNGAMREKNGEIDYDAINHMEYMDKFISEILRMYPFGSRLERRCTKEYKLPAGSNATIEKDTLVFIAVKAMHYDPKYYTNPEKFNPERFSQEEKAKRNAYTYMPFGQGPRNCIGMRFALMEAKVALAYLVYNFSIQSSKTTPIPMKLDRALPIRPVVNLQLKFINRN